MLISQRALLGFQSLRRDVDRGVDQVFLRVEAKATGRQVTVKREQQPQLFDRLCEAIVLMAGMLTVAMMQRNNEQVPLLSAGVSTHRIVAPVIGCACFMMARTILKFLLRRQWTATWRVRSYARRD